MNQPSKLTPVILTSFLMTAITLFPFLNFINFFCCAGIIISSVTGTMFYSKQLDKFGINIQYKDGLMIGILSGFLSAVIIVISTTFLSMMANQNPVPEVYKAIEQYGFTIPPDAEQFLKKISDEYNRSGYSITLTILSFVTYIITYPLFGAIGGLITVSILSRRRNESE